LRLKARVLLAGALAAMAWIPMSVHTVTAIYCYPGDPPAVYQACLAYNAGIGQQVNNQNQLNSIQSQINDTVAQINAIDALIASLKHQIDAQRALIVQTQAAIPRSSRTRRRAQPLPPADGR
jgi:septal ring factor EnvC (AmiA/AmiB activator)